MSHQTCKCGNWVKTNFKLVKPIKCPECGEKMKEYDNKEALKRYWASYD